MGYSLAVFVGLVLLFGGAAIDLPAVIGGGISSLRWVAFAPLIPAIALAQALESRKRLLEKASTRHLAPLDGGLIVGVMLSLVAVLAIADFAISPIPGVAFRNAVLIPVVTVLLTTQLSAPAASGLVTTLLIITQSYAPSGPHSSWIRIFQPEGRVDISLTLALVCTVCLAVRLVNSDRT